LFSLKKAAVFSVFLSSVVFGDNSTQQSIVFSVTPTNQIGPITGPAPQFSLSGTDRNCDRCTNMYSIVTNEENKKVIAYLDRDMPKGATLSVELSPPPGARSMGRQLLSSTPVDLLVEVSKVSRTELVLDYDLMVTPEAGVLSNVSRMVTYTMTDG
jgi:hypothetical protein